MKKWKKGASVLLAAAMVAGSISPVSMAAESYVETKEAPGLVAEFHFDDEKSGFVSEGAKAEGTYSLQKRGDGNALYLDGSSNYLNVTDLSGNSVLKGVEEFTVSFFAKPEGTAANWAFYAAPDGNNQIFMYEKYLGVLDLKGTITAERYSNGGTRPDSATAITDAGEWCHLAVVYTATETIMYVNGVEAARQSSGYRVQDILGDNPVVYIGKANWNAGEFYHGFLDNYKIYNRALTAQEIRENAAEDGIVKVPMEEGQEQLDRDYEWLTFDEIKGDNEDADHIKTYLDLPVKGENGSRIFWITSDASVLLNSGVLVSEKDTEQEVTLTATVVSGELSKEKTFTLKVLPGQADTSPLHIVEVGDSNTEFGRITQGMNEVLKEAYGNYGDGFLTLAKDYYGWGNLRPENYKISYTGNWTQYDIYGNNSQYAPFGIHVEGSGAGASINVEFEGSAVDIYYLSTAQTGRFQVTIDGEDKGIVDTKNVSGKTESKKAVYEDLDYGIHALQITRVDGYISLHGADYRVDDASQRKNISCWGNSGIRAQEYADVNAINPAIFEQAMAELNPDVVTLVIGTNDNGWGQTPDQFKESLTTMIHNVKASVPDAEIWVIGTFETVNSTEGLQRYRDEVFPVVAKAENVHYCAMGEWYGPYSNDYMEDAWHCDRTGGRQIAEYIYRAILRGEDVVGVPVASAKKQEVVRTRTGVPFEELNLPERVEVTLDDYQKTTTTAPVEWFKEGYNKDKAGTYTLTGTPLEDEELKVFNPNDVKVEIQVEVSDSYAVGREPGLVLYYDFGKINGTTIPDLAGNYDGTIYGNVSVVDGVDGSAIHFPKNVTSYVDIPVDAFNSTEITISAWMKLEELSGWMSMLTVASDETNYFQFLSQAALATGVCGLSAAIKDTAGKEYRMSAPQGVTLTENQWGQVTYTQKGRMGKVYLNGNLVASSTVFNRSLKDIISKGNAIARLGSSPVWADQPILGSMDELKVYNYAMSDEEVAELTEVINKTALKKTVENAVSETEQNKYESEEWSAYEEAFTNAKNVLADDKATQEKINQAQMELITAMEELVLVEIQTPPVRPFVDVDMETGDWYYNAVYYNYDREIMNGVDLDHFEPLSNLARAQFAIILHNIEGKPSTAYEPKFKDVADGEWYTEAIMWASSNKIVTGYTDGSERFGWGDNILREQMAVMMHRYAENFKNYNVSDTADFDRFEDAQSVSAYAEEAMKWAVGTGIITGKDNGTRLDPQGYASRAECAIIIQRFLERYEK